MITYLVKFILCSGLLCLVYHLFLSGERMYRFNRFYLLISLIFSLSVPMVSITSPAAILPASYAPPIHQEIAPTVINQSPNKQKAAVSIIDYLRLAAGLTYCFITLALLARFAKNLYRISQAAVQHSVIDYQGTKLVLIDNEVLPHSFLNYIFINKADYRDGLNVREIICHEQAHVKQLHTLDVLFVELLQAICWFNPFILLYKRFIQLNHEFLADEYVIDNFQDKTAYQYLLLSKACQAKSLTLTSPFNYLTTKKRLIMMTKTTSSKMAMLKQLAVTLLFVLSVFLFCQKVTAQGAPKTVAAKDSSVKIRSTRQNPLDEFKDIFIKYGARFGRNGIKYPETMLSEDDQEKVKGLFKKMTARQQEQVHNLFFPLAAPMAKISPTEKQLNEWKNAAEYGVWIDGKKIKNAEINNYKASDFCHYFVSRLTKYAIHHNEYHYQIDLMTKNFYAQYYKEAKNLQDRSITLAAMFPAAVFK